MISADREWHKCDGASSDTLAALRRSAGRELPDQYIALLRFSNGGEGPLPMSPYNLCLDSAESAAAYRMSDAHSQLHPGFFVFGGNGGGTLLAIDVRGSAPWPVVCFDGIDLEGSLELVAHDFTSFVPLIGLQAGAA
jgi:hypothetical protein